MSVPTSFKFVEFNSRRAQRGAEAARVEVTYSDDLQELLWMSKRDIAKNMMAFGPCEELTKAHQAYSEQSPRQVSGPSQAQGDCPMAPASERSEPDEKDTNPGAQAVEAVLQVEPTAAAQQGEQQ